MREGCIRGKAAWLFTLFKGLIANHPGQKDLIGQSDYFFIFIFYILTFLHFTLLRSVLDGVGATATIVVVVATVVGGLVITVVGLTSGGLLQGGIEVQVLGDELTSGTGAELHSFDMLRDGELLGRGGA